MNCEHATQLISLSYEQKLRLSEQLPLQIHLWKCPRCQYFKQNTDKLKTLMKEYAKREI